MQPTNIIGDTCKDRRIDYGLIDRINRQYEIKARMDELKAKLAKKKEIEEGEEKEEQNPLSDIKYLKTPDELRDIKGSYSLQKGIYLIDFEIHVPNGCGLILEPGVSLYFTKDAGITCGGRFEAKGKSGLEVLLTAKDKDKGWKNLYLKGGAEAILDYAGFSYGKGRKNIFGNRTGGAILLETENTLNPSLKINNSCFENNSAGWGGAISNYHGDIRIKNNNRFENNSAGWGGAIYINKGEIIIKENNIFKNNSAKWKGGAISNYYGDIIINENNRFESNSADLEGGAIRNHNGTLDIDESKNIFKGNKPDNIYENWK